MSTPEASPAPASSPDSGGNWRSHLVAALLGAGIMLAILLPQIVGEPTKVIRQSQTPSATKPAQTSDPQPAPQPATQPAPLPAPTPPVPRPAPQPEPPPAAAGPFAWTLPAGWRAVTPGNMRLAQFAVELPADATRPAVTGDCGVFLLPASDPLANLNRWRGQVGLAPIDAAEMETQRIAGTAPLGAFSVFTISAADTARPGFLAGILPKADGQMVFVKLTAPTAQLDHLRDSFLAFCTSLRP